MQNQKRWLVIGVGAALLLSACTKEEAKPYESAVSSNAAEAADGAEVAGGNSGELTLPPGLGGPSQATKVGEAGVLSEGAVTAATPNSSKLGSETVKRSRGFHNKKHLARAARKHKRKH